MIYGTKITISRHMNGESDLPRSGSFEGADASAPMDVFVVADNKALTKPDPKNSQPEHPLIARADDIKWEDMPDEEKKLLARTSSSRDVFEKLKEHPDLDIRLALLENTNFTDKPWFIEFKALYDKVDLVRKNLKKACGDWTLEFVDVNVSLGLAGKDLDDAVKIIVRHEQNDLVRYALALNTSLDQKQRGYFSDDRYIPIHRKLGTRPLAVKFADAALSDVETRKLWEGMGEEDSLQFLEDILRTGYLDGEGNGVWWIRYGVIQGFTCRTREMASKMMALNSPDIDNIVLKESEKENPPFSLTEDEIRTIYSRSDYNSVGAIRHAMAPLDIVLDYAKRNPDEYRFYMSSRFPDALFDIACKNGCGEHSVELAHLIIENKHSSPALLERAASMSSRPGIKAELLLREDLPDPVRDSLSRDESVLALIFAGGAGDPVSALDRAYPSNFQPKVGKMTNKEFVSGFCERQTKYLLDKLSCGGAAACRDIDPLYEHSSPGFFWNILRSGYLSKASVSRLIDVLTQIENTEWPLIDAILEREDIDPDDVAKICKKFIVTDWQKGTEDTADSVRKRLWPRVDSRTLIRILGEIDKGSPGPVLLGRALDDFLEFNELDDDLIDFAERKDGWVSDSYIIELYLKKGDSLWSRPDEVLFERKLPIPILGPLLGSLNICRSDLDLLFGNLLLALFKRRYAYYFDATGTNAYELIPKKRSERLTMEAWSKRLNEYGARRTFEYFKNFDWLPKDTPFLLVAAAVTRGLSDEMYRDVYEFIKANLHITNIERNKGSYSGRLLPFFIQNPDIPADILLDIRKRYDSELRNDEALAKLLSEAFARKGVRFDGPLMPVRKTDDEDTAELYSKFQGFEEQYVSSLPHRGDFFDEVYLGEEWARPMAPLLLRSHYETIFFDKYPKQYILPLLPWMEVNEANTGEWEQLIKKLGQSGLKWQLTEVYGLFVLSLLQKSFANDYVPLDRRLKVLGECVDHIAQFDGIADRTERERSFAVSRRAAVETVLRSSIFRDRVSYPITEADMKDWELVLRGGVSAVMNKPLLNEIRDRVDVEKFAERYANSTELQNYYDDEKHKILYFLTLELGESIWTMNPALPRYVTKIGTEGYQTEGEVVGWTTLEDKTFPFGTNLSSVFLSELGHHYSSHLFGISAVKKYESEYQIVSSGMECDDRMALSSIPPMLRNRENLESVLSAYRGLDVLYKNLGIEILDSPERKDLLNSLKELKPGSASTRKVHYYIENARRILEAKAVKDDFPGVLEEVLLGEAMVSIIEDPKIGPNFKLPAEMGKMWSGIKETVSSARDKVLKLPPDARLFVEGGTFAQTYGNIFPSLSVPLYPVIPNADEVGNDAEFGELRKSEGHINAEWLVYYVKRRARELLVQGKIDAKDYVYFIKNAPTGIKLFLQDVDYEPHGEYRDRDDNKKVYPVFGQLVGYLRSLTPEKLKQQIKDEGLPFYDPEPENAEIQKLEEEWKKNKDWNMETLRQKTAKLFDKSGGGILKRFKFKDQ